MKSSIREMFDLTGRVAIVTGGAGFLGRSHIEAIADAGGVPVIWDTDEERTAARTASISDRFKISCKGQTVDVTCEQSIRTAFESLLREFGKVDILINNAGNDPKVDNRDRAHWARLENLSVDHWNQDIAVGLTGALLCSRLVGAWMARRGSGVIVNIASDLGIVAPDQRIYRKEEIKRDEEQPVKPVSYSVVKHGLIGLTRYLATYWADKSVRVNALCPGGVYSGQDDGFVKKLNRLIPLGRMARVDEYKAAIVFLASEASAYMTGQTLVMDGGRSVW